MRYVLIALVSVCAAAGGLWVLTSEQGTSEQTMAFIESYGTYRALAEEERALLARPGNEDAEVRARVHEHLTALLTGDLTSAERLTRAEEAAEDLALQEETVAAIGAVAPRVTAAREELAVQVADLPAPLRPEARELVALLKERRVLVGRIADELAATHDQTAAIVARIIAEEGRLSPAHVAEINAGTSVAEERFDEVRRAYQELDTLSEEIDDHERAFVGAALG
ncbi:hypothetical protein GVX82_00070 [Patescibacteria group bacterium]|jgi:hypothetical protein|nr:hypothetical protein [Patescibacteria group bacterium]